MLSIICPPAHFLRLLTNVKMKESPECTWKLHGSSLDVLWIEDCRTHFLKCDLQHIEILWPQSLYFSVYCIPFTMDDPFIIFRWFRLHDGQPIYLFLSCYEAPTVLWTTDLIQFKDFKIINNNVVKIIS